MNCLSQKMLWKTVLSFKVYFRSISLLSQLNSCFNVCKSKLSKINKNLVVSFSVDPCASAPVVGPCKGTFPRWYYDQNAGECKHFLYGGCQGNHNNFLQQSDCVSECIQKSENPHFLLFLLFNLILQHHQNVII